MRTSLSLLTLLALCAAPAAAGGKTSDALADLRGAAPDSGPAVDALKASFKTLSKIAEKRVAETDRFLEGHQAEAAKFQAMKSVHIPIARNWCSLCHASVEDPFAMREDGNKLCLACHKPQNESLRKSHMGVTLFTDKCTVCHDPHASSRDKLVRSSGEHGGYSDCASCHSGMSAGGRPALKDSTAKACFECHPDVADAMKVKGKVVHGALDMGSCTNCHNPHFSPRRALLRAAPQEFCRGCHDIPDTGHPFGKHRSFKAGEPRRGALPGSFDCLNCHLPHTGELPKLLRAPKKELCVGCHKM